MAEALFTPKAAEGYDGSFRDVSHRFVPTLLRLGGVAPAQRVLDVATGTGIAAEAAAEAVGSSGCVVAADVSPAMLEKARARLGAAAAVSFALEDGQALSMPDGEFDAVLCHLGLMFFADPARGLAEFLRVLRPGGRVAVSVNAPARSFLTPVFAAVAAQSRSEGGVSQRLLRSDLDPGRLRELLEGAGFGDVAVTAETHCFVLPSFGAYFAGIEAGGHRPGLRPPLRRGPPRRARGGAAAARRHGRPRGAGRGTLVRERAPVAAGAPRARRARQRRRTGTATSLRRREGGVKGGS